MRDIMGNSMKKIGFALAMLSILGLIGRVGASTASVGASANIGSPVCAIGVYQGAYQSGGTGGSSASIDFGTLTAGQTVTPGGTDSPDVTVYNDSTALVTGLGTVPVVTGITISGTDWSNSWPSGSVSDTSVALVAYDSAATNGYSGAPAPFALSGSPSGLILDMGPSGSGYGTLAFGLTVPSGVSGSTTQTITVYSTC